MTLALTPTTSFTDDLSTVTADTLNTWRANFPKCVDGAAGGAYTPTSAVQIGGSGLELTETSGAAKCVQLASRARTIVQPLIGVQISGTWVHVVSVIADYWQNTATSGALLHLDLTDLPDGQVLDSVTVKYDPAGGHGGLPVMPVVTVYSVDVTGATASLGTKTDDSADVPTYEASHNITVSGIAHTIDKTTYRYIVRVQAEGAVYIADAIVRGLSAAVTITSLGEF
jgi:hypothetical protein